ncbi:hypothetical protein [Stappia sp. WLB 29]|uniref:hypothetical protein n=1 Tax=Stappia sp. WLB 29 TaxID=2925220 RepID=UPI0020C07D4C|nr:hypothetical protein [Stappia sp. WLB 29]
MSMRNSCQENPRPEPGPTPAPTPFPPPPVREPDPGRLPDEDPLPNPDETDSPPQHARDAWKERGDRPAWSGKVYYDLLAKAAAGAGRGAGNEAQECRTDMTFGNDDKAGKTTRRPHQPSPLGGRYFADLLKNVENEPVPDRLLDLAHQLEQALAERHGKRGGKPENGDPDKG